MCDFDPARCAALAAELGVSRAYADAGRMLAAEQPDVLVFATPPAVREAIVALGLRHRVRARDRVSYVGSADARAHTEASLQAIGYRLEYIAAA